jgi:hypothetical protein
MHRQSASAWCPAKPGKHEPYEQMAGKAIRNALADAGIDLADLMKRSVYPMQAARKRSSIMATLPTAANMS